MKGFVPTPPALVDLMVNRLFQNRLPVPEDTLLDPGCGDGVFLAGVVRWCVRNRCKLPRMVGIESEPGRARAARSAFALYSQVQIRQADFLAPTPERFDFIIGNPPYVPITGLDEDEKRIYRLGYETARGRFDLYLLFFERGIKTLKPGGRLVFITPEKFLYVETARPLRNLLGRLQIEEIRLVDEATFCDLVTYPTITTVANHAPAKTTAIILRDGQEARCRLNGGGESWIPIIRGSPVRDTEQVTLQDVCQRISCGVATGADSVFVRRMDTLDSDLMRFAHPTISGRELIQPGVLPNARFAMLIPYDPSGGLMDEVDLGALGEHLAMPVVRRRLMGRTCVRRKPWYAFHETPVLREIQKPKILCKDIGPKPCFWVDRGGEFVPRHSVYYIVPSESALLGPLAAYLNSPTAARWLLANCQRAANNFVRLQSTILKRLPLPRHFRATITRMGDHNLQRSFPIEQPLAASLGGTKL
jgi:adenine-specific DNA-methyltransferase